MSETVYTIYDPQQKIHHAVIHPPLAEVTIIVHIEAFGKPEDLDELFLYNFDVDSNAIEFPFGARVKHIDDKMYVDYSTDPSVHVPPFRIQISHQRDMVDLSVYRFSISWQLRY